MIDTKDRILDSAERIIAENGYAASSLRSIIAEAGVNLAAVHYHFGSKEGLLKAVIHRRIGPVNRDRLAMLDEFESRSTPCLEEILQAFLAPTLQVLQTEGGPLFVQVMGRLYGEGDVLPRIMPEQMSEIVQRFSTALRRALPDLPDEELLWRVHFSVGAVSQALRGCHSIPGITGGLCDASNAPVVLDRLTRFLSAAFRAPVANAVSQEK
jgi:AcrR family transcriptional regulator